jgi:hypothetical protein
MVDQGKLSQEQMMLMHGNVNQAQPKSQPSQGAVDAFELNVPAENVTKHWYDWEKKVWESKEISVLIDWQRPIAEGSLRVAYRMIDLSRPPGKRACAVKHIKAARYEGNDQYYIDIEMQEACRAVSRAFNSFKPPKPVTFLEAWVIKRKDSNLPKHLKVLAVEPYINPANYVKHNNNFGFVQPHARNTPQCFSHFSWEHTLHRIMIVDIQGVGDMYTDPQIHTPDGRGFGQGNCGDSGIQQFLRTHRCNPLCEMLGLPPTNGRQVVDGTKMPRQPWKGRTNSTADSKTFQVSNFVRDLLPIPNTAPSEDLSMLGLTSSEFNKLAKAFNKQDPQGKGFLVPDKVFDLLRSVGWDFSPLNMELLLAGLERSPDGNFTFKHVLLWYRGLA